MPRGIPAVEKTKAAVLSCVRQHPGERVTTICARESLAETSVKRALRSLVAEGLVSTQSVKARHQPPVTTYYPRKAP